MCWRSALLAEKNSSRSSEACGPAASARATAAGATPARGGGGRPLGGLRLRAAQPHGDDGGMGRAALRHDELEIGGGEAGRVPQDRSGDVDDVARQAQDDGPRGGRIERQPLGHRGACRHVGRVDQPQRQLGIVALVVRRMGRFLQIEVGQHPQQGRADVETLPVTMIEQTLQAGECRRRFGHGPLHAKRHTSGPS